MRADPLDVQAEPEDLRAFLEATRRGGVTGISDGVKTWAYEPDDPDEPANVSRRALVGLLLILAFIAGVAVGWVVWG